METIRRYVFPLLWMAIFAVIALALARLAFFPAGAGTGADPGADVTPGVSYEEFALVTAQRGDITSVLQLTATVEADPAEKVTAERAGEITEIWVKDGDWIEEGARILEVRVPQEPEPAAPAAPAPIGPDGAPLEPVAPAEPAEEQETEYRYYTLEAEHSGFVRDLAVEEWDDLAEDAAIMDLSPGTYSVVAPLTPEQQLDLLDVDVAATMTLPTSPEPIPCASSSIEETEPTEGEGGQGGEAPAPAGPMVDELGMPLENGGGSGTSSAELRCAVPKDAKVVPGLGVDVMIDLGSVTGVLTVPTTAVEGELAAGAVYVLDQATGEPVRQEVTLGLRGDGIVEITGGLEEGQEILEFVPGVDSPEGGMYGEEMVW